MIGTKVASMILDSRQLNFYKVSLTAWGNSCHAGMAWTSQAHPLMKPI